MLTARFKRLRVLLHDFQNKSDTGTPHPRAHDPDVTGPWGARYQCDLEAPWGMHGVPRGQDHHLARCKPERKGQLLTQENQKAADFDSMEQ